MTEIGYDFRNKSVIVTGASRGIGRDIALAFAEARASVIVAARNREQLQSTAELIRSFGGAVLCVNCDISQSKAVDELVSQGIAEFGKVDILVNNAAVNYICSVVMSDEARWRQLYEVNVFGVYYCTKAVLRHMIKARSGRIINISSIAGKFGSAYNSAYASSKAAVIGLTKSVARETARMGITVNAICPWHVDSELLREAMAQRGSMFGKTADEYIVQIVNESPQKRLITAKEIVAATMFLASSGASGITGQTVNVCGGVLMD
jgi:3-oxoacyl-[acyl-carrier protein] reductase